MRTWMRRVAVTTLCLALLAGGLGSSSAARERSRRPSLILTTFPCDGMGLLFKRILTEAYGRIGYDVEFKKVPAERGLVLANQGDCDGVDARAPAIEASCDNLIRVPTPLYVNTVVAFSKNTSIDLANGWDGLAPYKLGSVLGYKFVEKKTSAYNRVFATCYGQLFAMLKNDRLDVAIAEYLDVMPSLRGFDFGDIRLLSPSLGHTPMYHYLHKKHEDLEPVIADVLREMQENGRMDVLLEEVMAGVDDVDITPCKGAQEQ